MKNDVAWHLEEKIADEEDAGAEAVDGLAEAEVGRHLQLGEADVDAVEIGNDVAQHQERHDAPEDLAVGGSPRFDFSYGLRR